MTSEAKLPRVLTDSVTATHAADDTAAGKLDGETDEAESDTDKPVSDSSATRVERSGAQLAVITNC